jgi:hypothetical protein
VGKRRVLRKGCMEVNMVDVFSIMYENRRVKPIEIALRRGEREGGRTMEG